MACSVCGDNCKSEMNDERETNKLFVDLPIFLKKELTQLAAHRQCARQAHSLGTNDGMYNLVASSVSSLSR